MLVSGAVFILGWVTLVIAGIAPQGTSPLRIRDPHDSASDTDAFSLLRRALSSGTKLERRVTENSTSLDRSWNDAVLFSSGIEIGNNGNSVSAGVEIKCKTCYIKGTTTAQFTLEGDFNVTETFLNASSSIKTTVDNVTQTAVDYIDNYFSDMDFTDGVQSDDFDFPPIPPTNIDFNISVPEISGCSLEFKFDGMELYMEIDTVLSSGATYTINLYTSQTPIGLSINDDIWMGVVFTVDLILSVETEIDISSGFHIQLNDGVAINIALFEEEISKITFNGGNFEFLPVTVQSAGVVFTATLRVGAKTGLELTADTNWGLSLVQETLHGEISAGVEAGVWADVAQFTTNITAPSTDSICEIHIVEEYAMLLGAGTGATVAIGFNSWGPTPNTQVSIWYTTLTKLQDTCLAAQLATSVKDTPSTAAVLTARDDGESETISTEVTYTATLCQSTGLLNCPLSLQSTSKVIKTLTTTVLVGSETTFPATVQSTVSSTVAFKTAHEISSLSGKPVSYIPPAPSTTGNSTVGGIITDALDGKTSGVSNKVIIGVSVGLGVPVLLAVIAIAIFLSRRKRYAPVQRNDPTYFDPKAIHSPESYSSGKFQVEVTTFETPRP